MDRRQFFAHSATVAAAVTCGSAASAGRAAEDKEAAVFPIVDTHQHLWDLSKFKLPWLKSEPGLAKSYLMADYLAATADLPTFPGQDGGLKGKVTKTVYMEVDVEPSQQPREAEYVLSVCKAANTPMVAAVISGRPASEEFKTYISRYKGSPYIKGVRQVLHNPDVPAGYCLGEQFVKGVKLLGDLGMSFDLCMRPTELLDGAKLADACPDTRFILDHCGNAKVQGKDRSQWERDIAAVARRKNVVGKVSGIVASAKPGAWTADDLAPIINHTAEVFGHDRIMFGGDWPVCTLAASYKQWVEALASVVHGWKDADRRKLFHDNAVRFYGLG